MKKLHRFTLKIENVDRDTPNLEDALYEAGCDDALIHFRGDTLYLEFDRKAYSLAKACASAVKDVLDCRLFEGKLAELIINLSIIAAKKD